MKIADDDWTSAFFSLSNSLSLSLSLLFIGFD